MGRRQYQPPAQLSHEFELDLAPLLAVMVKLVPVLLVSSAFVQMMMLETDLPQPVKAAIARNEQTPGASLLLEVDGKVGFKITVEQSDHTQQTENIVNRPDGSFDLAGLHQKLVDLKTTYPEVYKLELSPAANISYRDIVKIMDEARKAKNRNVHFPVFDSQNKPTGDTNYMFPNVVFSNMAEG